MVCMIDGDRLADWTALVRSEYTEMPGLSLTAAQMARLFGFDPATLEAVVTTLVHAHVLRRTIEGSYVAFDSAH
jgi:hypothetical protein